MADTGRSRSSKRLKLDPDFVHELYDDHCEEAERYLSPPIPTNELSPVDSGPVKEVNLASLPVELVQEIFRLLSIRDKMSLRLVNRQLYTVCSDPYLWRRVFIDDAYGKANGPFVKSTLKTCQPHVQSLSLEGRLPFSQYQSIVFNCKNIRKLNFYGFEINMGALKKILVFPTMTQAPLPHLQYLTLSIYSRQSYELVEMQFLCLSHLKKLVIITNYDTASWQQFNQNWERNHCLPRIFVLVSDFICSEDYSVPNMSQSAYFVYHTRYRRPLNFDFYDVPQFRRKCGPDTVAVTANGELMVKVRDFVTPTTQPNDDDLCRNLQQSAWK
uniref:F-box domain-containing protein n=1 Tax=Amphimedon queenslandica TaxID=400682 RepID=A0A1X7TXI4_AMPQE